MADVDDIAIQRWSNAVGHALLKTVTLSIGGGGPDYWRCLNCSKRHDINNKPHTCGAEYQWFREDLVKEIYERHMRMFPGFGDQPWAAVRGTDCLCPRCESWQPEEMDDCPMTVDECISNNFDVYETKVCTHTNFERQRNEGHVIDTLSSNYLAAWNELVQKENTHGELP